MLAAALAWHLRHRGCSAAPRSVADLSNGPMYVMLLLRRRTFFSRRAQQQPDLWREAHARAGAETRGGDHARLQRRFRWRQGALRSCDDAPGGRGSAHAWQRASRGGRRVSAGGSAPERILHPFRVLRQDDRCRGDRGSAHARAGAGPGATPVAVKDEMDRQDAVELVMHFAEPARAARSAWMPAPSSCSRPDPPANPKRFSELGEPVRIRRGGQPRAQPCGRGHAGRPAAVPCGRVPGRGAQLSTARRSSCTGA